MRAGQLVVLLQPPRDSHFLAHFLERIGQPVELFARFGDAAIHGGSGIDNVVEQQRNVVLVAAMRQAVERLADFRVVILDQIGQTGGGRCCLADGIAGIADYLFQLFGRFFRRSRVADSGDIVVETRVIFRRGRKAEFRQTQQGGARSFCGRC